MKSEYQKKTAQIQKMTAMSPEEFGTHLAMTHRVLNDIAPGIALHINSAAANAVKFLDSKIPKPAYEMPGAGSGYEPSKSQQASFLHYHEAVSDPIGVLKHVADGSLSTHHLEALQAVHPDLLQEMRTKVMENATPKNLEKLSYAKKIALSKFLGQPMDSSLLPGVFAAGQAAFQPPQPQAAQQGARKPTQSGMNKLNMASRAETETNKEETDV